MAQEWLVAKGDNLDNGEITAAVRIVYDIHNKSVTWDRRVRERSHNQKRRELREPYGQC